MFGRGEKAGMVCVLWRASLEIRFGMGARARDLAKIFGGHMRVGGGARELTNFWLIRVRKFLPPKSARVLITFFSLRSKNLRDSNHLKFD